MKELIALVLGGFVFPTMFGLGIMAVVMGIIVFAFWQPIVVAVVAILVVAWRIGIWF